MTTNYKICILIVPPKTSNKSEHGAAFRLVDDHNVYSGFCRLFLERMYIAITRVIEGVCDGPMSVPER